MGERNGAIIQVNTHCLFGFRKKENVELNSEHPASMSAMKKWADYTDRPHVLVKHNNKTGSVDIGQYESKITNDLRVVSIVHLSCNRYVVGCGGIVKIRSVSPNCLIIVDGINIQVMAEQT